VAAWLAAGARTVWVVDPAVCTLTVHRAGCGLAVHGAGDVVRDDELLPGLAFRVRDVLD
jgi:hypothetical protein